MDFDGFLMLMGDKNRETDIEIHYKDTFRAFSKDDDGAKTIQLMKYSFPFNNFIGCIPADELKFVMNHLPGKVQFSNGIETFNECSLKVALQEIDEMIKIVDKNGDGRISYSEFRFVLIISKKILKVLCPIFQIPLWKGNRPSS